jgi:hypothetical protein
MFKIGDKVKIVPTLRSGWNSGGRMEASVGMFGEIVNYSWGGDFDVKFSTTECDTDGHRALWTYAAADLRKVVSFKGNK